MTKIRTRLERHLNKHQRVRETVAGTAEKPRLCVFRSLMNIYAQIIDDSAGKTLVSASTLDKELRAALASSSKNRESAKKVGELVAKRAIEKGISQVVFDRGGYLYHGRVRSLAEGARDGGLKF